MEDRLISLLLIVLTSSALGAMAGYHLAKKHFLDASKKESRERGAKGKDFYARYLEPGDYFHITTTYGGCGSTRIGGKLYCVRNDPYSDYVWVIRDIETMPSKGVVADDHMVRLAES